MKRREFIAALGCAAAWPMMAREQQAAMPVIGFLGLASPDSYGSDRVAAFRTGLSEAGYVEGQNVAIEFRWAHGRFDKVPVLAAELVDRKVSVIVAAGTVTARVATATIPIVANFASDPVEAGYVTSLNRPGGNVTGINMRTYALGTKRLELLRETVPKAEVIAVLINPSNPSPASAAATRDVETAARTLGQRTSIFKANSERDFEPAFARVAEQGVGGLLVMADPFINIHSKEIVALAERHAIPAIYEWREFAAFGGLMSYGTDASDAYRRMGLYTGEILNGTNPADLPIDQSVKVELVLNLKTAKALGVTFSLSLLGRADEVIE